VSEKQHEPDTVHEFIEALNLFDSDHDGKIPITEMRWALTQLGEQMTEEEVDDLIKEVSKDGINVEIMDFARITYKLPDPDKEKGDKKEKKKK
jgi:Ca2+-binding EF-hand superfamily protein